MKDQMQEISNLCYLLLTFQQFHPSIQFGSLSKLFFWTRGKTLVTHFYNYNERKYLVIKVGLKDCLLRQLLEG